MNGLLAILPFFSEKRPDSEIYRTDISTVSAGSTSGQTSVSRYVDNMPVVSGVARYLDDNKGVVVAPSGVAKYMANKMGVAEYVAPISRVQKYIQKQSKQHIKQSVVLSSVTQYITSHHTSRVPTSVARYIAKKVVATRTKANLSGVAKYQLEQEMLERKKTVAKIVKKYLEKQSIITKAKLAAEAEAAEVAITQARIAKGMAILDLESGQALSTVERYAKKQALLAKNKPTITRVNKYLANKVAIASQKPPVSRVEKYLANQAIVAKSAPQLSGVAKYVQQKTHIAKSAPKASGVAQYMLKKSTLNKDKPELSGVAKYLTSTRTKVKTDVQVTVDAVVDNSLEGEFIPANKAVVESSVDKYLQKQKAIAIANKPTGVTQYVAEQATNTPSYDATTQATTEISTGVEKYLQAISVASATNQESKQSSSVDRYIRQLM